MRRRRLREAGEEAYEAAYKAARADEIRRVAGAYAGVSFPQGITGSPACRSAARIARDEALAKFDRRNPRP